MGWLFRGAHSESQGVGMIFRATGIQGVTAIELERIEDERGFFARSFCTEQFRAYGLATRFEQGNISYNRKRGTLRGMHFQAEPKPETKVVRCTRGAIFDVAVDLRRDSATFCNWVGYELTSKNYRTLYIPPGCAHGFITLVDGTEVAYLMGAAYDPQLVKGVRWDDPAFGIEWPLKPVLISQRDADYEDFVV